MVGPFQIHDCSLTRGPAEVVETAEEEIEAEPEDEGGPSVIVR